MKLKKNPLQQVTKRTFLLVDLDNNKLPSSWQSDLKIDDLNFRIRFTSSSAAALEMLSIDNVSVLVVFAKEDSPALSNLLSAFQYNVGYLPEFQAIICDEPSPWFMAAVFEFGIEKFFSKKDWITNTRALLNDVNQILLDEDSIEYKTIELSIAVRAGNPDQIDAALLKLQEFVAQDYRAAIASAVAHEAQNQQKLASKAFQKATDLNRYARVALKGLADSMIGSGNSGRALEVLTKLEKTNPKSPSIKAQLAVATMQSGNEAAAMRLLEDAQQLADTDNHDVAFAKVQLLFLQEKYEEALKEMTNLSESGPGEAQTFVRMGLKLVRLGKHELATNLFRKAHKLVRPDIRYRVSLNAALAAYQLGELDLAMLYLNRCESEVGTKLREIDSIHDAIFTARNQIRQGGHAQPDVQPVPAKKRRLRK